jgi:hypothetical protein
VFLNWVFTDTPAGTATTNVTALLQTATRLGFSLRETRSADAGLFCRETFCSTMALFAHRGAVRV